MYRLFKINNVTGLMKDCCLPTTTNQSLTFENAMRVKETNPMIFYDVLRCGYDVPAIYKKFPSIFGNDSSLLTAAY